jgi:glycine cleavage system aminomethyltransferase T
MKTTFFILVIIFFCNLLTYSQENKTETTNQRAQCVFGELGGNGLMFSANYDIRFAKKQNGFGGRAGLGFVTSIFFGSGLTVPVGINYLAGKRGHYLEAGLGATIITLEGFTLFGEDINASSVAFVPSLGYRYQPLQNGFTGRIFVSPFISEGSTFWAGISAGYKF